MERETERETYNLAAASVLALLRSLLSDERISSPSFGPWEMLDKRHEASSYLIPRSSSSPRGTGRDTSTDRTYSPPPSPPPPLFCTRVATFFPGSSSLPVSPPSSPPHFPTCSPLFYPRFSRLLPPWNCISIISKNAATVRSTTDSTFDLWLLGFLCRPAAPSGLCFFSSARSV